MSLLRVEELEAALATAVEAPARIRAMSALATELARTGSAKRGLPLAREAHSLAEGLPDGGLIAASLHTLARCHFNLCDFVAALELLLEAARIYQKEGDLANAATALAGVGLCQHRLGAQEDAIASLLEALHSARELEYVALEINIHNSLGSAYLASGRQDDAARHLATGIELAHARGNKSGLTKLVHNQTLLAQRRGDAAPDRAIALAEYESGLALCGQALALARELGNRYDEAHSLGQSGTMFRLLGRRDEAAATLTAALELEQDLDEPRVQAEALLELGRLHLGVDSTLARRYLNDAIALAEVNSATTLLGDACADLSLQLECDGDLPSALALYKRFHSVRESEFAKTREHAGFAAQLRIDFQHVKRQAMEYREQARRLAADKEALSKRAEALAVASQQDPLTGLLNRRGLDAHMRNARRRERCAWRSHHCRADRYRPFQDDQRLVLACGGGRGAAPRGGRRPRALPYERFARSLWRRRVSDRARGRRSRKKRRRAQADQGCGGRVRMARLGGAPRHGVHRRGVAFAGLDDRRDDRPCGSGALRREIQRPRLRRDLVRPEWLLSPA